MNTPDFTEQQLAEFQLQLKQDCGEEFTIEQVRAFATISLKLEQAILNRIADEAEHSTECEEKP